MVKYVAKSNFDCMTPNQPFLTLLLTTTTAPAPLFFVYRVFMSTSPPQRNELVRLPDLLDSLVSGIGDYLRKLLYGIYIT